MARGIRPRSRMTRRFPAAHARQGLGICLATESLALSIGRVLERGLLMTEVIGSCRFIFQDIPQTEVARRAAPYRTKSLIPPGRAANGLRKIPARLPSKFRAGPIVAQSQKRLLFRRLYFLCYFPASATPHAEKNFHQLLYGCFVPRIGTEIPGARKGRIVAGKHATGQQ